MTLLTYQTTDLIFSGCSIQVTCIKLHFTKCLLFFFTKKKMLLLLFQSKWPCPHFFLSISLWKMNKLFLKKNVKKNLLRYKYWHDRIFRFDAINVTGVSSVIDRFTVVSSYFRKICYEYLMSIYIYIHWIRAVD